MSTTTAPARPDPAPTRTHDARRTRAALLAAARAIFADAGYTAANISDIVARAGTTKPTVYYHFGSKQGLFAAVLEDVYAAMRAYEQSVDVDTLPPLDALRQIVEVTFDYHAAHPDWIRLIAVANIDGARHILGSATIADRNAAVVDIIGRLLRRGERAGVIRPGIDPLHLHLLIASVSFYRVSNRHTWKIIFGRDLGTPAEAAQQRQMVVDAVLTYVRPPA